MALKKTSATFFGTDVVDAYHRVEGLQVKRKDKILFQVRVSVDGVKPHFSDEQYQCAYNIHGDNPIRQAYAYLKTLPEFAGATDC